MARGSVTAVFLWCNVRAGMTPWAKTNLHSFLHLPLVSWNSCISTREQCCILTTKPHFDPLKMPCRGSFHTMSTRERCLLPTTTGKVSLSRAQGTTRNWTVQLGSCNYPGASAPVKFHHSVPLLMINILSIWSLASPIVKSISHMLGLLRNVTIRLNQTFCSVRNDCPLSMFIAMQFVQSLL